VDRDRLKLRTFGLLTPRSTIPLVPTDPSPASASSRTAPPAPARRIPEATVSRLPIYQRVLEELLRSGITTVSSELLASTARVNAAKVRKDLSMLGSFGTRGSGYDTAFLIEQIDRQLGLDREWPVVIAGVGNLGRALARSQGFAARNFDVAALLDTDPSIVGERIGDVVVRHVDELPVISSEQALSIGVITTPPTVAQRVCDLMIASGIRSILNFAPQVLEVPSGVLLRYVDLSIELQVMSFYQSRMAESATTTQMPGIRSIGIGARP
jgi:redox-sensing transcriptional repressor